MLTIGDMGNKKQSSIHPNPPPNWVGPCKPVPDSPSPYCLSNSTTFYFVKFQTQADLCHRITSNAWKVHINLFLWFMTKCVFDTKRVILHSLTRVTVFLTSLASAVIRQVTQEPKRHSGSARLGICWTAVAVSLLRLQWCQCEGHEGRAEGMGGRGSNTFTCSNTWG